MNRFLAVSTLSLMSILTLNAGQIYIETPGSTPPNQGLTANYLGGTTNTATTTSCAGAAFGNTCYVPTSASQGSTGTGISGVGTATSSLAWSTKSFTNGLFTGASNGSGAIAPLPATLNTDSGGVFDLSQSSTSGQALGVSDFGYNSSGVPTAGTYDLTIPVGIYGVTTVDTMLQDFWGSSSNANGDTNTPTSVVFEFGATSNVVTTTDSITLTNGAEIRAGVQCTSGTGTGNSGGYAGNGCPLDVKGNPIASTLTDTAGTTIGDAFVTATNIYTASYTSIGATAGGGTNLYANTVGNVDLDMQSFYFGSEYAGDYLVAIEVVNQMVPYDSKVTVSAVSVFTPEPSTLLMMLAGLGAIGLGALRNKRKQSSSAL